MATIDRAKLLESLAEHIPDFDPFRVLSLQVFPTYATADISSWGRDSKTCWKPGCPDKTRHSHPKRWEIRGG